MLKLYKIPGSYVYAFIGEFGVGKTLGILEQALMMANAFKLKIAANFYINDKQVRRYCRFKKLNWFAANGRIIYKDQLLDLFRCENAILMLDEAGVKFFSRGFVDRSREEIFDRLFRIRHFGNFLFYTAQAPSQVDKQLRDRTHTWVACKGFQRFSVAMRRSKLYARSLFAFNQDSFEDWNQSVRSRNKFLRSIWLSEFRFTYRILPAARGYRELLGFWQFVRKLKPELKAGWRAGGVQQRRKKQEKLTQILWAAQAAEELIKIKWSDWRKHRFRPCDEQLLFNCFASFQAPEQRRSSALKDCIQCGFELPQLTENGKATTADLSNLLAQINGK